jgi:hypothetical protein
MNNYYSQRDNYYNKRDAESNQLIAISGKRDSTSMKVLAVVTMIFLPGTFVAVSISSPVVRE